MSESVQKQCYQNERTNELSEGQECDAGAPATNRMCDKFEKAHFNACQQMLAHWDMARKVRFGL